MHNVLEVAINRDWIVVMAEEAERSASNDNSSWLQETNVVLRQILLGCEIVVPFLTGSLLSLKGDASLWIVLGLKGFYMVVVATCMQKLCQWVPALQQHQQHHQQQKLNMLSTAAAAAAAVSPFEDEPKGNAIDSTIDHDDKNNDSLFFENDNPPTLVPSSQYNAYCSYCSDFKIYFSQKGVVGAGMALGFLYANILSFGGIMVAYLAETGSQSTASLGLWKGLSNVSAVFGTVVFSWSNHGVETKGLWGLITEASFLSISVLGIYLNQTNHGIVNNTNTDTDNDNSMPIGSILLISGTIASRMGLWAYDLSVTQLYQTKVPDSLRGTVGGTQTIINNAFEFVPFVLTMLVSGVQEFWIVMVVGYCCVLMALLSYIVGTDRGNGSVVVGGGRANNRRYGRVGETEEEEEDKNASGMVLT